MKHKHKSKEVDFEEILKDTKTINLAFLGAGLMLFLLNISSFLAFLPKEYSFTAFDISVFSSILLILIAVYNLHSEK